MRLMVLLKITLLSPSATKSISLLASSISKLKRIYIQLLGNLQLSQSASEVKQRIKLLVQIKKLKSLLLVKLKAKVKHTLSWRINKLYLMLNHFVSHLFYFLLLPILFCFLTSSFVILVSISVQLQSLTINYVVWRNMSLLDN